MTGNWLVGVQREYVGLDARYEFPVRTPAWARAVGAVLVAFGLFFAWGPGRSLWKLVDDLRAGDAGGAEAVFGLFQLPFLLAGCVPLVLGSWLLFGRTRVEWRDGRLRVSERLGPLGWPRRLPGTPLRRLEVLAPPPRSELHGGAVAGGAEWLACLMAHYDGGHRRILVVGYPKDWLLSLAQELKSRVGSVDLAAEPVDVAVVERPFERDEEVDVPAQPSGSRVLVEEGPAALRLEVPPLGVWQGSKGLFFFGLLWCGFISIFSVALVSDGFDSGPAWVPLIVVGAFWCVGLGMLAAAVHLGRRSARLSIDGGRLRVVTRGLFRTRSRQWEAGEIVAVGVGESGIEVNERPVLELKFHQRTGKPVGVLAGRDEQELRWLATRLRQTLALPARPGAGGQLQR